MRLLQFIVFVTSMLFARLGFAQTATEYMQEASGALSQKNYEGAIELYTLAINLDSNLSDAYIGRGIVSAIVLEYSDAISDFTDAISIAPTNATYYAYKASLLHEMFADKYALACIDTAIFLKPKFSDAYTVRGRIETSLGDTVKARADIEHALQLEPKLAQAMIDLGMLHLAELQFDYASADLTHALAIEPDNEKAMMGRAIVEIAKSDFAMAKSDLTGLIATDSVPALIELRAQVDLILLDTTGTMSDLALASKGGYLSPKGYWTRAKLRKVLRDTTGALDDYLMTLSLSPAYEDPRIGLANLQIDLHEYRAAQATMTQGIVIDSTVPDFWYIRARAREGLDDTTGAIEDYLETVKRSRGYSEAYVGLGRIYLDQGDTSKALRYMNTAVEVDSSANTFHQRAFIYEAMHRNSNAIADEERALVMDSTLVSAYINLGCTFQDIHQHDSAVRSFRKGLQFDANDRLLLLGLCRSETALHHFPEALSYINEVIRLYPNDNEVYRDRGDLHWQTKEYETAIDDYDQALRIDPKDVLSLSNRSMMELSANDTIHAVKDIQLALRLAPEDGGVLFHAGFVEFARKNNAQAIGYLRHSVAINPKNSETWRSLGNAYQNKHMFDSSIIAYTEAIQLNSECAYCYANRGLVYFSAKDTANALKDLHTVQSLHDSSAIADVMPVLIALGNSSFAHAGNSNEGTGTVKQNFDFLIVRAQMASSSNNDKEAASDYRRAWEIDPSRTELLEHLGYCYQRIGKYDSAYYFYDKYIQLFPEEALAYDGRGVALNSLGRYNDALPDITQAIELGDTTYYPRLNRAISEMFLHQYDAAKNDIDIAYIGGTSDERVHKVRMQVYDLLHQYSTLITIARQAQTAFPEMPAASYELATALAMSGSLEQALTEARHCLVLRRDVQAARLNALVFWKMNNLDSARFYYSMALRIKPGDSTSLLSRGLVFLSQKKLSESVQDMDQLIRLHPDCPVAYATRAEAEYSLGDRAKAVEDAHIALRNPDMFDPKIKEYLETNVK